MGFLDKLKSKLTGAPSIGELIDEVPNHIEKYVGPIDEVFHEIISDKLHIDIYIVTATPERPYVLAFTTGMAMRAMKGPPPPGVSKFAELMVFLPPDWPLEHEGMSDEANYWPIRQLKNLARLPHQMRLPLKEYISVPFDDPPRPAPGTNFGGFMAIRPELWPPAAQSVKLASGPEVQLYALMPLTMEEMAWKAEQPTGDSFMELIKDRQIDLMDMIITNPTRPSLI